MELVDTQRAFDGVASSYDRSNEANVVIRAMRERTIEALTSRLPPGSRLLDLGCGPGRDAFTLASRGYDVTAIDWSPAMVAEAEALAKADGIRRPIVVRQLGIHDLDRLVADAFDGAYSDLGPFNCVPDLNRAAGALAERIRPGGFLVASVIGRFCPWELALYAARIDPRRAAIRFARNFVAVPLEGETVWTRYYWPSEFQRPFLRAGFTRVSLSALGLFVPPPYLSAFASRHPRLITTLQRIDDAAGGWPVMRHWGDHFLIVLRRNG